MATEAQSKVRITAIDEVSRVMAGIKTSVSGVTQSLGSMALQASALVGAGGLGAYLASATRNAINTAASLDEVSQKTGIAVRDLSGLAYAAKIEGVSIEALQKAMKGLSGNLIEAGKEGSQAGQVFRALDIDAGQGLNKTMEDLADVFSTLEDGALKTTLATNLFGKSGLDLIPILNQGAEGIRKSRQEAEAFGLIVGDEFAKQADEFNDNIERMTQLSGALGISIAQKIVPVLNEVIGQFLQARSAGLGFFSALSTIPGPNANKQDQIKGAIEDLDRLQKKRESVLKQGGLNSIFTEGRLKSVDEDIAKQTKLLGVLRAQAQASALADSGGNNDTRDARANPVSPVRVNTRALSRALADPGAGSRKGETEKLSDYQKLSAQIEERIVLIDAELAGTEKLSDAEKLRIKVNQDLSSGQIKLSKAEQEKLDREIAQLQVSEEVRNRLKSETEARGRNEAAMLKEAEANRQQVEQILEAGRARVLAIEEIGLEGMQLVVLKNARLDAAIAEKEALLVTEQSNGASADRVRLLETEIKLLREQKSLNINEQSKREEVERVREAMDQARSQAKSIEDALANAMLQGFSRGGVSAKQIGDQLKAYFATLVLKPIIDPIAKAGAGMLTDLLRLAGDAVLGTVFPGVDPGGVQTGFSTGGKASRSGMFSVGEAGPETVYLPKGSEVIPAGATAIQKSQQSAAPMTINTVINPPAKADQAWLSQVEKRVRDSTIAAILQSRRNGGVFAGA